MRGFLIGNMLKSNTRMIENADLCKGEFNNCEHTFLVCEKGKMQTISVLLPNDEVVTFCFVPGKGDEIECVDIHSTVGQKFKYEDKDEKTDVHFVQHAIGFSRKGDTFDTRNIAKPTALITLLLGSEYHKALRGGAK